MLSLPSQDVVGAKRLRGILHDVDLRDMRQASIEGTPAVSLADGTGGTSKNTVQAGKDPNTRARRRVLSRWVSVVVRRTCKLGGALLRTRYTVYERTSCN